MRGNNRPSRFVIVVAALGALSGSAARVEAQNHPDLQGVWTNATLTPLERPVALGTKAFLTEAEAADLEKQAAARRESTDRPRAGDVGNYNQFWMDSGTKVLGTRQTSLVVDPPNGRVPLRPEAEARRDAYLKQNSDQPEFMSVWDRCITRGTPGGMIPAGYNNAYQIIQAPGYVVIHYEMIHEARIIPLDGRPHPSKNIGLWLGDSRGRWEGQTLVVETTNFNEKGWVATSAAAGRIKGIPQTKDARVVERFTRVDVNTLRYDVTVTDPTVFTQPWTMSYPLSKEDDYRIYEYACHEGNHAVPNILRGARVMEKTAGTRQQ
jgi:hypothetical protein